MLHLNPALQLARIRLAQVHFWKSLENGLCLFVHGMAAKAVITPVVAPSRPTRQVVYADMSARKSPVPSSPSAMSRGATRYRTAIERVENPTLNAVRELAMVPTLNWTRRCREKSRAQLAKACGSAPALFSFEMLLKN